MTDIYNVLLIEDDHEDYLLTKLMLKNAPHITFELTWADNPEKGINFLNQNEYDICLIDYNLGANDGVDFLKKAIGINKTMPYVFLTGLNNPELDNKAIQLGASDYLVKDTFDAEILERTIRHSIERKIQETELLKTRDELAKALDEIKRNQNKLIEMENLKSVQQLAGAVAHEFSQPLQALLNYADLIKIENPGSKYHTHIREHIEKISQLTDNLRNITQLSKKPYLDNEILNIDPDKNENKNINHILVVDDEPSILETLTEMFRLKGFVCDGAADGSEALLKTRQKKYSFIVSDINMPVMDGAEFFKHFREDDKNTPFIFITGYEVTDEIKRVIKEADALINKPVNFEHFFNMVQNIVKNRN